MASASDCDSRVAPSGARHRSGLTDSAVLARPVKQPSEGVRRLPGAALGTRRRAHVGLLDVHGEDARAVLLEDEVVDADGVGAVHGLVGAVVLSRALVEWEVRVLKFKGFGCGLTTGLGRVEKVAVGVGAAGGSQVVAADLAEVVAF